MKPLAVTFIAVALLASPLVAAGRDRRPDQGESLMNAVDDLSKDAGRAPTAPGPGSRNICRRSQPRSGCLGRWDRPGALMG
jgi:hypothetical protein